MFKCNIKEMLLMQQAEHKHDELVKKAVMEMPDIDILYDLAELFKVFADSTRVRILYLLLHYLVVIQLKIIFMHKLLVVQ